MEYLLKILTDFQIIRETILGMLSEKIAAYTMMENVGSVGDGEVEENSSTNEKQEIPSNASSHANEGLIHGLLAVKLYSWYLIACEDLSRMARGIYPKCCRKAKFFRFFVLYFLFLFFLYFFFFLYCIHKCFPLQAKQQEITFGESRNLAL